MPNTKAVVFFDIDGTIIDTQSQRLFINYLLKTRRIGIWAYARLLLWFLFYKLRLAENPRAIMEYGVSFLRGMSKKELEGVISAFFKNDLLNHFRQDIVDILRKHQKNGDKIVLVSNAIKPLVQEISRHLGVDDVLCTQLVFDGDKFDGKIEGGIMYGERKVIETKQFLESINLLNLDTWAYADHISDADLLFTVKNPVAVYPDKKLKHLAKDNHWDILPHSKD